MIVLNGNMKMKNNTKVCAFLFALTFAVLLPNGFAAAANDLFTLDAPQQVVVGEEFEVSLFVSGSSQTVLSGSSIDSPSDQTTFDIKIGVEGIVDGSKKILSEIYNVIDSKWQSSFLFVKEVFAVGDTQKDFRLKVTSQEFEGTAEIFALTREGVGSLPKEVARKNIEVVVPKVLVNINFADTVELETLSGVGPVIAQSIVDYRMQHGPFETLEDIMNVSGIGQAKFDNIKDVITVGEPTVLLFLRHEDNLVVSTMWEIPQDGGTITIVDDQGEDRAVADTSVFGVVAAIDAQDDSFEVSQAQYFASFSSLYLKCMKIVNPDVEACDNWQYVVDGVTPFVGMDGHNLTGGEVVWVYFGNPRQVVLSKSEVEIGEEFTVIAQSYGYEDDTWSPAIGFTIGVTKPNPDDPWNPIEVAVQEVDDQGSVVFTIEEAGEYSVGIKEDFYFPSTQLVVIEVVPEDEPVSDSGGNNGGGGGGNTAVLVPEFNTKAAVEFLYSQQKEDGSFEVPLFVLDWVAVAFGAYDISSPAAQKLQAYFLKDPFAGTLPTDYQRRAMALMALRINPYTDTPTNYINEVAALFDGTQIGDPDLVNDDIFGLLVLRKAGYGVSEEIISKTVAFVLEEQKSDGSWVGGVDMTAAAMQSLVLVKEEEGVAAALEKARVYLENKRQQDGGFGNVYGTSWAVQAVGAGADKISFSYLLSLQVSDGGVEEGKNLGDRIWATSYAIPAGLEKPWGDILGSFAKPEPAASSGGGAPSPTFSSSSSPQPVAQEQTDVSNVSNTSLVKETMVEVLVLVGSEGEQKEVRASLRIAKGNEARVLGEGEWNGSLELKAVEGVKDMPEVAESQTDQGETIATLQLLGAVQVFAGEGVALEFEEPIFIRIPVLAADGEIVHVFSKSELEDTFAYESTCVILNLLCEIETKHLSWFVATAHRVAPGVKELLSAETVTEDFSSIQIELENIKAAALGIQKQLALLAREQLAQETYIARAESTNEQEEVSESIELVPEVFSASIAEVLPKFNFDQKISLSIAGLAGFLLFGIIGGILVRRKRTGERVT
jgi:competence ComEA-like helix-hairpin-helix protein